jgi:recombination protein RecA
MVSLSTIAEIQKNGGIAAFIDAEHALTPDWARSLGVDFDNLLLTQPESGEKALSIMKFLVEEGKVDVIVLDSVAALVTQREIDGDMDANHMALTARLMSLALKKLTPIVSKSKTCCIFINQIRENVGQMFGNKETTPGGKALKFYSSVRLRASKKFKGEKFAGSGDNKVQIGHTVTVKVLKNKVAPPFREAEFDLYYNSGIDQNSEVKGMALAKGVVVKAESGNKHVCESLGLEWPSKKAFEEAMDKDKELVLKLKEKVIEALKNKVEDVVATSAVKEVNGMLVDTNTGEILDESVEEKDLE